MEAGREMDALVAEKVMKLSVDRVWYDGPYPNRKGVGEFTPMYGRRQESGFPAHDVPNYSTDIAAAWQVVEKLTDTGEFCLITCTDKPIKWICELMDDDPDERTERDRCDSVCLAICRAALRSREAANG